MLFKRAQATHAILHKPFERRLGLNRREDDQEDDHDHVAGAAATADARRPSNQALTTTTTGGGGGGGGDEQVLGALVRAERGLLLLKARLEAGLARAHARNPRQLASLANPVRRTNLRARAQV